MNEPMKQTLQCLLQAWLDDPESAALMPSECRHGTAVWGAPYWIIQLQRVAWVHVVPGQGFAITSKGIRALAAEKALQS